MGTLTEIWNQYNSTRMAGDKKTANRLLPVFIKALQEENKDVIKTFVDDLCYKTLESDPVFLANNGTEVSNNEYRIQHPLFRAIILPVLAEQYLHNSALHIKWIGQLEQFFYSDEAATAAFLKQINVDGNFSTAYFLERSFRIHKSQHVVELILNRTARDIQYYLHELPVAVLAEPAVFATVLEDFSHYLKEYQYKEHWLPSLSQWEHIGYHWTSYFNRQQDYSNFIDYQHKHSLQLL
ncbi:MAG: hypothetical protein EOO03_10075 [Chitinophagaceae bacterium]|nr:MAG: hypothetical protein EOO03_10075 [Chitinophagaceae bacterium]